MVRQLLNHMKKSTTKNRRFTAAQVRRIRRLFWEGGWTQAKLAEQYKCSQPTIFHIVHGYTYADVQ